MADSGRFLSFVRPPGGPWRCLPRRLCSAVFLAIVSLCSVVNNPLLAQSPPPLVTPAIAAAPRAQVSDVSKVERLLAARRDYQSALEALRQHYVALGDVERARWAEEELVLYHRITKQAYNLDLDVPVPTLQPIQNIPEANELYRRAMTYKDHGWGTDYLDNQHRAEILFQQLLTNYPQCNKISDAAYQLGDLYEGKVYKQYRRSAVYFERCIQWNPNTQLDARIRAARLYDKQLAERIRAIELYREVTSHEVDPKHIDEANRRLAALSAAK